jgi:hypothetical protein
MLMGVSLFALGFLAEAIAGLKEKIEKLEHSFSKRKRFWSARRTERENEKEA